MKKRFLLLSIFLLLMPLAAAQAQPSALKIKVEMGFGGYAKQNAWIPIIVRAENTGAPVSGEIRARSDYPGETYAISLNLPAQSQKTVTFLVPNRSKYTVKFVTDDGETRYDTIVTPRQLAPYDYFVGVIAGDPGTLNLLGGLSTGTGNVVSVAHLTVSDLPAQSGGLVAFNALIFNDVDTTVLSAGQIAALADWVAGGGRLVVGGGPNAGLTVAGLQSLLPAADFVLETLPRLDNLAALGKRAIPNAGPFIAAVPQTTDGIVKLYEQDFPFWVQKKYGRGDISYFALDFSLAPLDGWAGNDTFWNTMLDSLQGNPPFFTGYAAPQAITDILANIPGAGLPSPWRFTAFLCFYFLFLVPINYFVLKRMKRRELAWLTIPALILLFTVIGYAIGFRSRGSDTLLRQLSVVQQPNNSAIASETAFLGLYSPVRDKFTLKFSEEVLVRFSDAQNGYRGIKTNVNAPTTIFYGASTELRNLWTDIGSMSTVMAQRRIATDPIDVRLTVDRSPLRPFLKGTIVNRTPYTFSDVVIIAGSYGYPLGELPPGETQISAEIKPLDAAQYTGQTMWRVSYDQVSLDERVRDQTIRAIVWGDQFAPLPVKSGAGNSGATNNRTEIMVIGWRNDITSDLVTVDVPRVVQQAQELRIITAEDIE